AVMHLSLIVFFLPFGLSFATFTPLRLSVMRPSDLGSFSDKIENSLRKAIHNLSGIISVLDYGPRNITWESVLKCSKSFMLTRRVHLMRQINAREITAEKLTFDRGFLLSMRDFLILLESNRSLCERHQQMMASAVPCSIKDGTRPLLGVVNICPGKRWKEFQAGVDLFRHELLHTLGFGTLVPSTATQKSPPNVKYYWTDTWGRSSAQMAKRRFLDFAVDALEEAKKYLGCPTLAGVEADSADKIHLNEYIYGNELMTPSLSNVSNRFSYISAAILEGTFLGDKPWYRVNRSAIRSEHDALWYGRDWGCTFAERSCFDFIEERTRKKKSTFPFCSKYDYYVGGTKLKLKRSGTVMKSRIFKCWSQPFIASDFADNGIRAHPLTSAEASSRLKRNGSPSKWRFCPMAKIFVDDRFDLLPG
ncbi:hypothetical protein V3C99_011169, partial [Haemonchus contortus]